MSASSTRFGGPARSAAGILDRSRIIAGPGYNRWLVPPAALAIHLCIGMAYGFSVFWLPLSRAIGSKCPAGSGHPECLVHDKLRLARSRSELGVHPVHRRAASRLLSGADGWNSRSAQGRRDRRPLLVCRPSPGRWRRCYPPTRILWLGPSVLRGVGLDLVISPPCRH